MVALVCLSFPATLSVTVGILFPPIGSKCATWDYVTLVPPPKSTGSMGILFCRESRRAARQSDLSNKTRTGAKTRAGKGTEGKDKYREKTSVGSEKVYSSYQMRNKRN
jgi:hypothetical protein